MGVRYTIKTKHGRKPRYNPPASVLNIIRDMMIELGNRTWTHLELGKELQMDPYYLRECLDRLEEEGMAKSTPIEFYGHTIKKYWIVNKKIRVKPIKYKRHVYDKSI